MTPEEELIKLCDAADRLDTGFVGRLNARGFMATPDGIALARRHAALELENAELKGLIVLLQEGRSDTRRDTRRV